MVRASTITQERNIAMLQKEFEERVGYIVTPDEYKEINAVYMRLDSDKDEFCYMWANSSASAQIAMKHMARIADQQRHEQSALIVAHAETNKNLALYMLDKACEHDDDPMKDMCVKYLGAKVVSDTILSYECYDITEKDKEIIKMALS